LLLIQEKNWFSTVCLAAAVEAAACALPALVQQEEMSAL